MADSGVVIRLVLARVRGRITIMKYWIVTCLLFCGLSAAGVAAESYLVMEAHTGRVLLAASPEQKRPVASLTKVATAKVVLDWAKASGTSLATQAIVPQSAFAFGGANPLGLRAGDKVALRDAIYSALLGSDNIAAHTLADFVGRQLLARRQRTGDPQRAFVSEMNNLAKSLGMRRTRFANAHGLELPSQRGYSTASDMARLCVYAMRDTGFAFYVKQKSRTVAVHSINGVRRFKVANTNKLLGVNGINGIKTGLTTAAGQCLAVNSHRKPLVKKLGDGKSQIRHRDLVVVVLGSADRFGRTRQLVTQAWPIYDNWAAQGYPVSKKGKELIVVPKLR